MNVRIFKTFEEQARGLQHRPEVEPDTLFVFPYITEGALFHSRNVRAPFDLAFLSNDFRVLLVRTLVPEGDTQLAPTGTHMAVEAAAGELSRLGFLPGRQVTF